MKRYFGLLILALVCVMPARAWNCTDPLASRVDVGTTKPAGTAGDGDGQYYIGSDAANPKDYYVCEVPKPPTTPPPTAPSQTQTQSQNQTSTSASNASSTSNSNSSSTSNSQGGNATASGGAGGSSKSSSTSQGGNATGGNVSGSGNSTNTIKGVNKLTNSGNSQTTNTLSASGGQQSQTATGGNQTQSATATNNGNGANNSSYSSTTNVAASKIPVETAFVYAAQPTVNCASTFGAGGQGAAFGLSLSGTKIDKNCADLEAARKAPNKLAYCKVYIRNDYVRKAGVTLEDCMLEDKQVVVVTPTPVAAVTPPPTIIVNIPAPVSAPVPVVPALTTTVTLRDFGTCNVFTQSNVCKQEISSAIRLLLNAGNGRIVLTGPVESGKLVPYIVSKGLSASRVELKLSDDQNSTLTVETFVTQ